MSLLEPTPGELFDRLTILQLKIQNCRECPERAEEFITEYKQIHPRMIEQIDKLSEKDAYDITNLGVSLSTINGHLWALVDLVRATPNWRIFKLAHIAKRIHLLNDQRSELIRRINLKFGIDRQEKLYE